MHSQFLHIGMYGLSRRRGAARHETAMGMLSEAARQPSATGHLLLPGVPRQVFGDAPQLIAREVSQLGKASRDSRGRKLRSDAHLLMCLVASFPWSRADVLKAGDTYARWLDLVLAWLQRQYGAHLAGVVEHSDEAYFHIHAFVLPPLRNDGQLQWETVHPGRRAKKSAAESGDNAHGQDAAYVAAMEEFQEDFHRSVSSHFGHARFTEKRERRPRAEHLKIRTLEAENADLAARLNALEQQLARLASTAPSAVDDLLLQRFGSDEPIELDHEFHEQHHWEADDHRYQAENAADPTAETIDWSGEGDPEPEEYTTGEDEVDPDWEKGPDPSVNDEMGDGPDSVEDQ